MTDENIRVAKRIVLEMGRVAQVGCDMRLFMGLGLALAFVFEEVTGKSAKERRPREIMQWAIDLPTPERIKKVQ